MTGVLRLYDGPSLYKTETRHHPSGKTCHHFLYHGLTCDEYDAMRARCGERCEICGTPEKETRAGRLVVDHIDRSGYHLVRGLLCMQCNSMIGATRGGERRSRYAAQIRAYDAGAWWKARYSWLASA